MFLFTQFYYGTRNQKCLHFVLPLCFAASTQTPMWFFLKVMGVFKIKSNLGSICLLSITVLHLFVGDNETV